MHITLLHYLTLLNSIRNKNSNAIANYISAKIISKEVRLFQHVILETNRKVQIPKHLDQAILIKYSSLPVVCLWSCLVWEKSHDPEQYEFLKKNINVKFTCKSVCPSDGWLVCLSFPSTLLSQHLF